MDSTAQDKPIDTDRLATALTQSMGSKLLDAGYTFRRGRPLSYDNVTLIYVRNHGNNITWFRYLPGSTRINQTLIARISSLKMNVPEDFRRAPHAGYFH